MSTVYYSYYACRHMPVATFNHLFTYFIPRSYYTSGISE